MDIKEIDLTVDELKETLDSSRWRRMGMIEFTEKWGQESIIHIPDIQEEFVGGYGVLVMKNKQGYIILPLDEDECIMQHRISTVNVDWAKDLKNTIESYQQIMKNCQQSIQMIEEIVKTQKIRLLFEGNEEGK